MSASENDIQASIRPEHERFRKTGLALIIGGLLIPSLYCFAPRTTEGPISITNKGKYYLIDGETGYQELQNTINIDNHKKCLRDIMPFGEILEVGDTLKQVRWRPGLIGPCDYIIGYEK